jgi:hypothetical protein
MTCEFPAWGDMTVSANYTSLMKVEGYGEGREKGRTTMPLTGIQTGTSASDSRKGNRSVKRKRGETEIEDGEVDVHFGVPVPPPLAPMAGPSRPSIMMRRRLTKIIDGQEYIIVDDDEDDPATLVHEAPPIKAANGFTSKAKKGNRRRGRKAEKRFKMIKRKSMKVDPPLPLHHEEIETSDIEVENELQDDEDESEYDELLSSEEEDYNSSHSEAPTVEIPEPGPSTMVGRM